MNPNIYVGRCEGSVIYQKWYYEAIIDHIETVSHLAPHIRIGFANTEGFVPYPGGGSHWGANGVGDDLFSYGFDGVNLWTGNVVFIKHFITDARLICLNVLFGADSSKVSIVLNRLLVQNTE